VEPWKFWQVSTRGHSLKVSKFYLFQFLGIVLLVAFIIFPSDRQLGIVFRKSHLTESSRKLLEENLRTSPNNRVTLENLAEIYAVLGLFHEREAMLLRLIHLHPNQRTYSKELLDLYSWQGDYRGQARIFLMYLQQNPLDDYAYNNLRSIYTLLNDYAKLEKVLLIRKRHSVESFNQWDDLIYTYMQQHKYDSASFILKKFIQKKPDQYDLYLSLAELYYHTGSWNSIFPLLNQYLSSVPFTFQEFQRVYETLLSYSFIHEASTLAHQFRSQNEDDLNFPLYIARAFKNNTMLDSAVNWYHIYLLKVPNSVIALNELQESYSWSNNPHGVVQSFKKKLFLEPSNSILKLELARLCVQFNQLDCAIIYLDQYLQDSEFSLSKDSIKSLRQELITYHIWNNQSQLAKNQLFDWHIESTTDTLYGLQLLTLVDIASEQDLYVQILQNLVQRTLPEQSIEHRLELAQFYLYDSLTRPLALELYYSVLTMQPKNTIALQSILNAHAWNSATDSVIIWRMYAMEHGLLEDSLQIATADLLYYSGQYKYALEYYLHQNEWIQKMPDSYLRMIDTYARVYPDTPLDSLWQNFMHIYEENFYELPIEIKIQGLFYLQDYHSMYDLLKTTKASSDIQTTLESIFSQWLEQEKWELLYTFLELLQAIPFYNNWLQAFQNQMYYKFQEERRWDLAQYFIH
jgi:predicted Zn-dependent protease